MKTMRNKARKRILTPWFNSEIYLGEKKQSRLFRRFIKSKKSEDHQAYKIYRKKLSVQKYRAKRAYYRNLLNEAKNKDDRAATWNIINKVLGKKSTNRQYPEKIVANNKDVKGKKGNRKHVANGLNSHFTSIAKKLAVKLKKTNTSFTSYMGRENKSSMYLNEITLEEILEEITNICSKKAMGHDRIPPKIIKWAPDLFAPILCAIYNKCFILGYYPNNMKIAKVVPLYKKGDKDDYNNYRPISILIQFNQLFERLISKRLHAFFKKFDLFTKKQFGFLKKHCTEHAILDLKEYVLQNMERKEVTAVLFLDLQKAFDTVRHDILLKKLQHYGVRGVVYNLLSSYLTGRKQFTKVMNDESDLVSILWGVPQGSVLGPLLFLIYINDLPKASSLGSWLFADDTALAMSSSNFKDLELKFNVEVNKVQEWLLANGLSVHYVDKTKYMLMHRLYSQNDNVINFRLNMGGHEIERTEIYKYLGVTIDDKLNWKVHIQQLCSKLASVCGVLSKVRHYLDRSALMLIYNSLFESRSRYALLAWGTASNHALSKLKVLQNRAVRFITFSPFRTAMAPLYSTLKILPLTELLFLQSTIFMHSLLYKNLPFALGIYCPQPQHRYRTRYVTSKNYVLPPVSTDRSKGSIKFAGPKAWAEVPSQLKEVAFKKPFAKKMKEHILTSTFVERTPSPNVLLNENEIAYLELEELFQSDDDASIFEGFDTPDLNTLFHSDSETDEFLGFDTTDLTTLFHSDSENDEFFGF